MDPNHVTQMSVEVLGTSKCSTIQAPNLRGIRKLLDLFQFNFFIIRQTVEKTRLGENQTRNFSQEKKIITSTKKNLLLHLIQLLVSMPLNFENIK